MREDPFADVWQSEVVPQLVADTEGRLQVLTLLTALCRRYPGHFQPGQLRTLQRRVRDWRVQFWLRPDRYRLERQLPGGIRTRGKIVLAVNRPALWTVGPGGRRAVQHLAFAPIEARDVVGRSPVLPRHAFAVDLDAARAARDRGIGIGRRGVDLRLAGFGRVGTSFQTNERDLVFTDPGNPNAAIRRARADRTAGPPLCRASSHVTDAPR